MFLEVYRPTPAPEGAMIDIGNASMIKINTIIMPKICAQKPDQRQCPCLRKIPFKSNCYSFLKIKKSGDG